MTVRTLIRFLIGDRKAILEIASNQSAIWIGLLFVLSAGFAREYDGEDLLHEPWHLALPLVASLGTSFILFCLIELAAWFRKAGGGSFLTKYQTFLTLYWMTAPLAWIYAIPVERYGTAVDAIRANLWMLGIVSLWRVALIIRTISVLYGATIRSVFPLVMLFADTVAVTLMFQMPKPVIAVMGGIRLTESEMLIREATTSICLLGILSWPIWLLATVIVFWIRKANWQYAIPKKTLKNNISPPLWTIGIGSILIWIPILPGTQSEQQLRGRVERLMKSGNIQDGLSLMSEHTLKDFPPHWDPPPRISFGRDRPSIVNTTELIASHEYAPWIRKLYLEKFSNHLSEKLTEHHFWEKISEQELTRYLDILERLPEGSEILAERSAIARGLYELVSGEEPQIIQKQREDILALLKQAQKKHPSRIKFDLDTIINSEKQKPPDSEPERINQP